MGKTKRVKIPTSLLDSFSTIVDRAYEKLETNEGVMLLGEHANSLMQKQSFLYDVVRNLSRMSLKDDRILKNSIKLCVTSCQYGEMFEEFCDLDSILNIVSKETNSNISQREYWCDDTIIFEIPFDRLDDDDPEKLMMTEAQKILFRSKIGKIPGKRISGNDICSQIYPCPQLLHSVSCEGCSKRITQSNLKIYYGIVDFFRLKAIEEDRLEEYEKAERAIVFKNATALAKFTKTCCISSLAPKLHTVSYDSETVEIASIGMSINHCRSILSIGVSKQYKKMFKRTIELLERRLKHISAIGASKRMGNVKPILATTLTEQGFVKNQNEVPVNEDEEDEEAKYDSDFEDEELNVRDPEKDNSDSDVSDDSTDSEED